jgi:murein DD-endopeptidase MepM/ murein hydrolase activator NlpD
MKLEPLERMFPSNPHSRHAVVVVLGISALLTPAMFASASFWDALAPSTSSLAPARIYSAQNAPLLSATGAAHSSAEDYMITDSGALIAGSGPSGSIADIASTTEYQEKTEAGFVQVYTVTDGDTIAGIAKLFGISPNTIIWANNISKKTPIKVGQTLTILPIDGVQHTVRKGETIAGIAKKFKGDADEISAYNELEDGKLAIGQTLFIPNGELAPEPVKTKPKTSKLRELWDNTDVTGYFIKPLVHYRRSQGIHGKNGVDLAGKIGEPIHAVADATVLVANVGGWGGGYGNYIVLKHGNGTQTLYGHMNRVNVAVGERVSQGDVIGTLGNSGRSTGPHLHIEVHGARNPF